MVIAKAQLSYLPGEKVEKSSGKLMSRRFVDLLLFKPKEIDSVIESESSQPSIDIVRRHDQQLIKDKGCSIVLKYILPIGSNAQFTELAITIWEEV